MENTHSTPENGSIISKDELVAKQAREYQDFKKELRKKLKGLNKKQKKKQMDENLVLEQDFIQKQQDEIRVWEDAHTTENEASETNQSTNEEKKETVEESEEEKLKRLKQKKREYLQRKEQKRRKKKLDHYKEISEEAKKSNRQLELNEINKKIEPLSLQIYPIQSDGNCLYRSIAYQLPDIMNENNYQAIRSKVAQYMRDNIDDFIYFLDTKDDSIMTKEQYMKYCDTVENTSEWGGQIELKAIAGAYKKRIEVFQSFANAIVMGEEYDEKDSVKLSYHRFYYTLGDHYNAVVRKDESDEF